MKFPKFFFENWWFWKTQFFWVGHFGFFFAWKSVKATWVSMMGRNFDDYPGLQQKSIVCVIISAFILLIWPILEARAEILTKKVHFLGNMKAPKYPPEINWLSQNIENFTLLTEKETFSFHFWKLAATVFLHKLM